MSTATPVFELRVALTSRDYERIVKFYCEGLGLEPAAIWQNGEGHALILDMVKEHLNYSMKRRRKRSTSWKLGNASADRSDLRFRCPT